MRGHANRVTRPMWIQRCFAKRLRWLAAPWLAIALSLAHAQAPLGGSYWVIYKEKQPWLAFKLNGDQTAVKADFDRIGGPAAMPRRMPGVWFEDLYGLVAVLDFDGMERTSKGLDSPAIDFLPVNAPRVGLDLRRETTIAKPFLAPSREHPLIPENWMFSMGDAALPGRVDLAAFAGRWRSADEEIEFTVSGGRLTLVGLAAQGATSGERVIFYRRRAGEVARSSGAPLDLIQIYVGSLSSDRSALKLVITTYAGDGVGAYAPARDEKGRSVTTFTFRRP